MEEQKIKIAALQMESVIGNVEANHQKLLELLDRNINGRSFDVLILPEVWTVGWECREFRASAEDVNNSRTIDLLSGLARKYSSFILGGSFVEKDGENYYNTCPVISPDGELIAKYRKNHLFSYYGCCEGTYVKAGDNPVMIDIKGFKTGLTICYDIRFPEIYRAYRKAGADLIVNMAAWPMGRANHWLSLTRARAVENQVFFSALTQSGKLADGSYNLGHSLIYDYNGEVLDEITSGDGMIFAEISKSEMYNFREKCTVLNDIHENYEVRVC